MKRGFDALRSPILWVVALSSVYTLIAFGWSAMGFLSPTSLVHLHEYSATGLTQEVGGHIIFGVVAALLTLDPALVLLCGAESILIDSDHLLAFLNFPVEPRLAHSISFALVAPLVLSRLTRGGRRLNRGVFLVSLSAIAAHLSYDVLAGNGMFPLLAPFSIAFTTLPYWTWIPLEVVAVLLCAVVGLRLGKSRPRAEE